MLGIFNKKYVKDAIKKTEALMPSYVDKVIVNLHGKVSNYEDYFKWLNERHPEWSYEIKEAKGMVYVSIKKKIKNMEVMSNGC